MKKTISDVKTFWENNPLFTGESQNQLGTKAFFDEHQDVVVNDCLAGTLDKRIFPNIKDKKVLDVGCGPGMWVIELARHGARKVFATDLTINGLLLTKKRTNVYNTEAFLFESSAEQLPLKSNVFGHVNCQGVIHHTPNTEACISEIARVLEPGGTAVLSVYYRNVLLRFWPILKWAGKVIFAFGGKLKGRGRENIYSVNDPDEIVRLYDGALNPIGKSYSAKTFKKMLQRYFIIEETYLHFFPARTLPFKIPKFVHKVLDSHVGLMIYTNLRKK